MLLTELVAIGAMLGTFGLIPLILLMLKTKPMPTSLPMESPLVELKDYRVITLKAKM